MTYSSRKFLRAAACIMLLFALTAMTAGESAAVKPVGTRSQPCTLVDGCTIAGPTSICSGSPSNMFTITGPAGATFVWSISGNGTIIGANTGGTINVTAGAAGSFTLAVTTTVPGGCTCNSTLVVTVTPAPTCTIVGPTSLCSGTTANSFTVTGPAGATFAWTLTGNGTVIGTAIGPTINVTAGAVGTIMLTATATLGGCTSTCSFPVTVTQAPVCTISPQNCPQTVCAGQTGLMYNVNAPAGAIITWTISGNGTIIGAMSGTSVNVTAGATGIFTLTATVNVGGCISTCSLPVTVGPGPTCTIAGPTSLCTGATGNMFNLTAPAGATVNWTISGNGTIIGAAGGNQVNVTAGAAGTFMLTATVTLNGCTATCTFPVTVAPAPTCTIVGPTSLCSGTTANMFTVTGPAGATFAWTLTGNGTVIGTAIGPTINVTAGAVGTIMLTATATLGGCTSTCSFPVTVTQAPVCTIAGPTSLCTGATGNMFNLTAPAGAVINWTISGNGTIIGSANGTTLNVTAGAVGAFVLTAQITLNGCTATCTFPVTVAPAPTCTIAGPTSLCSGTTANMFTVTGPAGATFAWTLTGNGTVIGTAIGPTINVTAGAVGTIMLTATATLGGCTSTCSFPVTVTQVPVCTIAGPTSLCTGATGNMFNLTAPAGAVISWTISGNGTIIGAANGTTLNVTAGAVGAFVLTAHITLNGCTATCTFPVTITQAPTCMITGPTSLCTGATGNMFNLTAPAGAVINWTISGNGTIIGAANGTTLNVTAGAVGTFMLTATATLNGCVATCTFPVTITQAPVCTIVGPTSLCSGSTANMFTVTGPAGAVVNWVISGNGTIIGPVNGNQINVTAGAVGTFLLTATLTFNGCTSTCTFPVTVGAAPTCTIVGPTSLCTGVAGNIFNLTAPAGAIVNWTISGNGTIIGSAMGQTINVTAGAVGTFTLTATVNVGGCISTCSFPVTVGPAPTCTIVGPTSLCSGATANMFTVTGPAGATFAWTITGNGTVIGTAIGPTINVTAGAVGTLMLTATATLGGCTSTCSLPVTVTQAPVCTITPAASCQSIVCAGETGLMYTVNAPAGATITWTVTGNGTIIGSTTAATVNVTAGAVGAFTLMATVNVGGCTSTCSLPVTITAMPVCTITGPASLCASSTGNMFTVNATPGATITWTISGNGNIVGSLTGNTVNVSAGAVGSFMLSAIVNVGGVSGCTATCTFPVTVGVGPTCTIVGPTSLCSGSTANTFTVTGPAGATFAWTLTGNGTVIGTAIGPTINVTAGAVGTMMLTATATMGGCTSTCSLPVTVTSGPTCNIVGPTEICSGTTTNSFTVTGPAGATFAWTLTGNGTVIGTSIGPTINVTGSSVGTITLTATATLNGCTSTCSFPVTVTDCVVNCPRTPGFWSQQCIQRGNGSTKFTVTQMNQITAGVNSLSTFFNWSNNFDSFCSMINPSTPMTQQKQALRQFAAMLANVSVGQLQLTAMNGDMIVLDLSTPVSFAAFPGVTTMAQLIAAIDASLMSANPNFGAIISVADAINNGQSIGTTCSEDEDEDQDENEDEDDDDTDPSSNDVIITMNQAVPNPFSNMTRIYYAVSGGQALNVSVQVYDISGRLVKKLADGVMQPGTYDAQWDGRNDSGQTVAGGVYFVKIMSGAEKSTSRILFMR